MWAEVTDTAEVVQELSNAITPAPDTVVVAASLAIPTAGA